MLREAYIEERLDLKALKDVCLPEVISNDEAIRAVATGRRDACESGDPGVPDLLNLCRQSFRA